MATNMFSNLLFSHIYDIDEIIRALCGAVELSSGCKSKIFLDSSCGEIFVLSDSDDEKSDTFSEDTSQSENIYNIPIVPLSFFAFLQTKIDQDFHLTDGDKIILKNILSQIETIPQLYSVFSGCESSCNIGSNQNSQQNTQDTLIALNWLREQVKVIALDWLGSHNMIPPSMIENTSCAAVGDDDDLTSYFKQNMAQSVGNVNSVNNINSINSIKVVIN